MYYDIARVLSYKRTISVILGARGCGKTFASKKLCIEEGLATKELCFVWVRRYERDIATLIPKFFSDIKTLFPDHRLYIENNLIKATEIKTGTSFIIGELIALSLAFRYKSNAYPFVKYLVFDEFISNEGYLGDNDSEVIKFLELMETIFRDRTFVRALLLGNNVSQLNPYFSHFKIKYPKDREFLATDDIVVQNVRAAEFIAHKKLTPMGKLIAGTDYGNYAIENMFLLDDETGVMQPPKGDKLINYNIVSNDIKIGVWIINGGVYFGDPVDDIRTYTLYVDDAKKYDAILINRASGVAKFVSQAYIKNRTLGYKTIYIKNEIVEWARKVKLNF